MSGRYSHTVMDGTAGEETPATVLGPRGPQLPRRPCVAGSCLEITRERTHHWTQAHIFLATLRARDLPKQLTATTFSQGTIATCVAIKLICWRESSKN